MTTARSPLKAVILLGLLLALAMPTIAAERVSNTKAPVDSTATANPAFTVYYFHGTFRCESCRRIEAWTEETVRREFAREIESGWVNWQAINAQEDANAHYADQYKIAGQTVILAAWQDGKVVRWKSLDEVWDLLQNKDSFQDYIEREVVAFMQSEQ